MREAGRFEVGGVEWREGQDFFDPPLPTRPARVDVSSCLVLSCPCCLGPFVCTYISIDRLGETTGSSSR